MNFSTTPPWLSIRERAISAYAVNIRSTSSGSADSEDAVNPTRSQNSTLTTFRSSATVRAGTPSGVAHSMQNFAPAGFS